MTTNVAFYGAGRRAQPYLQTLALRPDIQLVGVCDLDQRAAEQTAAGWGGRVFSGYQEMLEEARPDALWICVEPQWQGDVILKALELRIPFFMEPPGAVDFERARVYGRLATAANLVTTVGFTARYSEVMREAREYLGTNPIPLALGWWLCPPADRTGVDAEKLLWSDASRFVDALRFFCGDVDRVRALPAGGASNPGGLTAQLEFANGTMGVLTCATFARPEPRVELELMGEGWSISISENATSLRLAERDKTTILRSLNMASADHATAFLAATAARNPGAVASGYADSVRSLAVCHAIGVSMRELRPVTLAEIESPAPVSVLSTQVAAATPAPC